MPRFCLVFYSPVKSTQKILGQIFSSFPDIVGHIGNYRDCGFVSRGTGQFTPQDGANPTIGQVGKPEFVEEDRVEIVMNDSEHKIELRKVVEKLKQVHEYEEVVYHVFRLEEGI